MNIRNTTPKEQMLKKIRQALLNKRENPHPDFEEAPLYPDEDTPLDMTFARELTNVSGNFIYCESEITLIENLILLVEKIKKTKICVWEEGIQSLLESYSFPFISGKENLEATEVGITSCEYLIARNGSVMLSNGNASGRVLSIYPPIHVVFAKASQLVMDLKHAFISMKEKYGAELPTMISTVTGPSRTADIEKRLVLGAHGPKELYVFMIEDRF